MGAVILGLGPLSAQSLSHCRHLDLGCVKRGPDALLVVDDETEVPRVIGRLASPGANRDELIAHVDEEWLLPAARRPEDLVRGYLQERAEPREPGPSVMRLTRLRV